MPGAKNIEMPLFRKSGVPAAFQHHDEALDVLFVFWLGDGIDVFVGVFVVVVQFACHDLARLSVFPFGVAETFSSHAVAHNFTSRVLTKGSLLPWQVRSFQERDHTKAFQVSRGR